MASPDVWRAWCAGLGIERSNAGAWWGALARSTWSEARSLQARVLLGQGLAGQGRGIDLAVLPDEVLRIVANLVTEGCLPPHQAQAIAQRLLAWSMPGPSVLDWRGETMPCRIWRTHDG